MPVLYAALQAAGVTAFWDQECLNPGEPLVAGFTVGLAGSTVAVLVVSQGSLDRVGKYAETTKDNVLLGAPRGPRPNASPFSSRIRPCLIWCRNKPFCPH